MQWLGSEIPGPGGYTAEAYASEGNQEVHPAPAGAPHSQQRVSVALNLTEREPTIKFFLTTGEQITVDTIMMISSDFKDDAFEFA